MRERADAPKQGDEGAPEAPIGLHRVRVLEVDGLRVRVGDLEAIDGTPVVDVKRVLERPGDR